MDPSPGLHNDVKRTSMTILRVIVNKLQVDKKFKNFISDHIVNVAHTFMVLCPLWQPTPLF